MSLAAPVAGFCLITPDGQGTVRIPQDGTLYPDTPSRIAIHRDHPRLGHEHRVGGLRLLRRPGCRGEPGIGHEHR